MAFFSSDADPLGPFSGRRIERTLGELALGIAALWLLAALPYPLSLTLAQTLGATLLYAILAGWLLHYWRQGALGWANRVTLLRGILILLLTAALFSPDSFEARRLTWLGMATLALLLDGLDGWVARRQGCQSELGARFDMELDAFFILVLCLGLVIADITGVWVMLIGLMRYAFVLSGHAWPWLKASLPESFRRKAVCVWQIMTLLVALLPFMPSDIALLLVSSALAALMVSFALDIRWLYRHASSNAPRAWP
ncbi:CDP-alcohol phosphatidyltransferase family protein [Vreelandella rituensis]|uniref:CDP-alcohol phosphatidyltransferase n=1 Tax=Vreelandella rituensis TaxID=2282306 RepID=A0A368U9X9_9GAMM|nr:CDP-alcohol phosphatidyltransferase family protein [Halomonas rituensis]RCV92932.1 CDP-alcohol phosphatidyltransferase [Halomonas rituensis]